MLNTIIFFFALLFSTHYVVGLVNAIFNKRKSTDMEKHFGTIAIFLYSVLYYLTH